MTTFKRLITTRSVEALEGGQTLWDTKIPGFGVRCRTHGKSYFLKTRVHGQQRWLTIGRHGAPWTVEKARNQAKVLLGEIASGNDPGLEKAQKSDAMTVAQLCDLYLLEGCAHKKPSTVATDKGRIERHIKPLLGRKLIVSVSRRDVEQCMHDIAQGRTAADVKTGKRGRAIVEGGRGTASRTVGLLGGIFSFALERELVEANPVRGVRRYKDKRVERYLSADEQARLSDAIADLERCDEISPFAAGAVRMLLLTGARRGEVLTLRWSWIDLERALAFLPDSKSGQRVLYLSPPAIELLRALPRLEGNPFVFCGTKTGACLTDLKRPWDKIKKRSNISNLRLHDLRHNFASIGASGGLSLQIIGKLLGHRRTETTARYSHLADDPVRAANNAVAQKISSGEGRYKQGS